MLTEHPGTKSALRLGAYVTALAIVSTLTAWSAYRVGAMSVGMLDAKIIDGSGRAHPEPEWSAPAFAGDPRTDATAVSEASGGISHLTSVKLQSPPVSAPARVSSDAPTIDPAANFHSGAPGTFKTYCVRLCDGYYFPISFSTTSDQFGRDADACQSQCGSPARLFVHPIPGGGPATMVSLEGLAYTALRTAFLFRAKYDAQCRCQAQPWDQTARDKHRLFAVAAAAAKGNSAAASEALELSKKVAEDVRAKSSEREAADKVATQELASLAATAALEPPMQLAQTRRPDTLRNPNIVQFGALEDEPPKRGYIAASGPGRPWREQIFGGN